MIKTDSAETFVQWKRDRMPELLPNYASVTAYLGWVATEHLEGRINNAMAKQLTDTARAMITALRAKHSEQELETAQELVRRAEAAVRQGDAKSVKERYGSRV